MTNCTAYDLPRWVTCDECKSATKRLHVVRTPRPKGYCSKCCPCARENRDRPAQGKTAQPLRRI